MTGPSPARFSGSRSPGGAAAGVMVSLAGGTIDADVYEPVSLEDADGTTDACKAGPPECVALLAPVFGVANRSQGQWECQARTGVDNDL